MWLLNERKREDDLMERERRRFLAASTALGLGTLVPAVGSARGDQKKGDNKGEPEEVAAAEDLMREHGVLNRVLLIYEAVIGKIAGNEAFDRTVHIYKLAGAADKLQRH